MRFPEEASISSLFLPSTIQHHLACLAKPSVRPLAHLPQVLVAPSGFRPAWCPAHTELAQCQPDGLPCAQPQPPGSSPTSMEGERRPEVNLASSPSVSAAPSASPSAKAVLVQVHLPVDPALPEQQS
jgi:hypothetical protein